MWDSLIRLHKFTDPMDYEYSITFFWVDGEIIVTPVTKGSKSEVITRNSIQMRTFHVKNEWYEKQILVNGKIQKKIQIKYDKLSKEPILAPITIAHSHPKTVIGDEKFYSFFSDTDLNSLSSSNLNITTLVTDKIILAGKTSNSPLGINPNSSQIMSQINQEFFYKKTLNIELLKQLGYIFYLGEFKKDIKRIC